MDIQKCAEHQKDKDCLLEEKNKDKDLHERIMEKLRKDLMEASSKISTLEVNTKSLFCTTLVSW